MSYSYGLLSIASDAFLISILIGPSSSWLANPPFGAFFLAFFLFCIHQSSCSPHLPTTQLISWIETMKMKLYVIIQRTEPTWLTIFCNS
jgi:hypothetical protein